MPNADPTILQDPTRLEVLRRLRLLDSPIEATFDRLTALVSKLVNAPVTLVSLVDADRQFFKSFVGLPDPWATDRETPLSHSFCQHVVATNEPLIISDSRGHPLVFDNLAIPDLNVIAYVGIPITLHDGTTLGSFCAIDSKPRDWTAQEIEIVQELAASVIVEIELRAELLARQEAEVTIRNQNRVLVKANRELAKAQADAEVANQFKNQFLATMSHELRNPLNVVIGYTELMLATEREHMLPKHVEYQETILSNARTVLQLVNKVLDLSKIETGQDVLVKAPLTTRTLFATIAQESKATAAEKDLTFALTVADDIPETIVGDETRLYELVMHLVSNALKFTDDGGITIAVECLSTRRWQIAVTDTGIGIPSHLQEVIFSEFRQAQEGVQRGGAGLGLPIARTLAMIMGGGIRVKSKVGQGSTFMVTLPLVTPKVDANALR